jgi:tagatose 6-phosphate kinase
VIVTVTLNPALVIRYEAERVVPGAVNQVRRVRYRADGRGLAVARVLHTFGHDVVAAGLAGGSAGELIRNELARAGVATQFTRIAAESRRVVAVDDGSGRQVTSFAEPSPYITTEELGRLAADYRELLAGATAVVLCGSLPDGLPAETYGSFASYAAEARVPVILNTAGSALRYAVARCPALTFFEPPEGAGIKPEKADGAWPLAAPGSSLVLPTERGARALTELGEWRAVLPAGSGAARRPASRDALMAGFVPGVALGWSWPDMLRHAVALSAAWGPEGQLDEQDYERTLATVEVRQPGASGTVASILLP